MYLIEFAIFSDFCAPHSNDYSRYQKILFIRLKESIEFHLKFHNYLHSSVHTDIIIFFRISDHIKPVCLPLKESRNVDLTGREMIAAGWGKTEDSSSISQFLKKLNVEIITNEKCAETFGDIVQKTTICSIGIEGNSGTCQVRGHSQIR